MLAGFWSLACDVQAGQGGWRRTAAAAAPGSGRPTHQVLLKPFAPSASSDLLCIALLWWSGL